MASIFIISNDVTLVYIGRWYYKNRTTLNKSHWRCSVRSCRSYRSPLQTNLLSGSEIICVLCDNTNNHNPTICSRNYFKEDATPQSITYRNAQDFYPIIGLKNIVSTVDIINSVNWRNNVNFTIVPIFWIFNVHTNFRSNFLNNWMLPILHNSYLEKEGVIFKWRNILILCYGHHGNGNCGVSTI